MACSLHRWRITNAIESGEELNRKTARHLRDCGDCSEFLKEQDRLTEVLSSKKYLVMEDPSPHMRSKIMTSLPSESCEDKLEGFRWALAATLAMILLVAVLTPVYLADKGRPANASQEGPFDKLIEGKATAQRLVLAAPELSTQPLEAEISNLKADIEQAVAACASLLNRDILVANHTTHSLPPRMR